MSTLNKEHSCKLQTVLNLTEFESVKIKESIGKKIHLDSRLIKLTIHQKDSIEIQGTKK